MIIIIFGFFCLAFIAYLLNKVWELEEDVYRERDWVDDLEYRLSIAGRNYIKKTNKLKEIALHKQNLIDILLDDIKKLNTKLNAKKEKDTKILCKSSKKNSVKVSKRKR